jgi:hypothetical protein
MPLVFVSHAAADAAVAHAFQEDIKRDFLGMCDVFVSSALDSIQGGTEWNQVIKENLTECSILIGLLSPLAITRPWIYTEFGAGWIRGVPTIPVCHSGLDRGQLIPPLSFFQGLNLSDNLHLNHLYDLIAGSIGCRKPEVDFQVRCTAYSEITDALHIERTITSWANQLFKWNPRLLEKLINGTVEDSAHVPADLEPPFRVFVQAANEKQYLSIQATGMAMGTPVGLHAAIYQVARGVNFSELMEILE